MITIADIVKLKAQLLPTGRAYDVSNARNFKAILEGLAESEADIINDSYELLQKLFANYDNFNAGDARILEKRFGIIINEERTINERVAQIQDRQKYPNGVLARNAASYMEYRLQRAGFDVYVHENRFTPIATNRARAGVGRAGDLRYGDGWEFGTIANSDVTYTEDIRNYINVTTDSLIITRSRAGIARAGVARSSGYSDTISSRGLRSTFFIGGETFPAFANVESGRKDEFRRLILSLKPLQTTGFIITNYS